MIKMVAFDLDGTIGDTIPFSLEAFRRAVAPYVEYTLSDAEIFQTFGLNEIGMIKTVTGGQWKNALADFYLLYEQLHDSCLLPYKGIYNIIHCLNEKGVRTALITGKGMRACKITLEKFGMTDFFCDIVTGLETRPNKTESIKHLLEKYKLQPNEFYYIGDAVSDIKDARNADVVCLSAAWGDFADVKELSKLNAENMFYTTEQLYEFFSML